MTGAVRSWRLLVGLKQRRMERERKALQNSLTALDARRFELRSAKDQALQAAHEHAQARQRMNDRLSKTFKPAIVPVLRESVERCEQAMRRADAEVKVKETQLDEAQETLRRAEAAVARIDNQLQQARDRLHQALAQAEREQDDAADEDAEETAVARMRLLSQVVDGDTDPARRRP